MTGSPSTDAQVTVTVVDDPAELPALVARLRAAPLVALDTETSSHRAARRRARSGSRSRRARPRSGTSRSPIGPPAASSRAPAPGDATCRRSPTPALRAAARRCSTRSGGAQGRPRHQVRLAGAARRRGRAGRRRLRLDARELRARSRPPLARDRHALASSTSAGRCRPTPTWPGRGRREIPFAEVPVRAAAAYCGADSGDGARAARVLRARRSGRWRWSRCCATSRCRWSRCWWTWSGTGIRSTAALFARLRASWRATCAGWRARSPRWRARSSTSTRPGSSRRCCSRSTSCRCSRRPRPAPPPTPTCWSSSPAMGHELPRLILEYRELQKLKSTYVDALPARVNRQHRADPHQLQPDRCRHRPAQLAPIPTCRTSRSARRGARRSGAASCRAPGWRLPGGRLLPDRAAPHGAPLRGSGVHRGVPAGRRHPPADRGAHLRRAGRAGDLRDAGPGQDDQLRHHLRPGPVRPEPPARHLARRRRRRSSPSTSSASPGCGPSSTGRWSWRGSRATWRRCSGAAATSPRSGTGTSTCGPTASAPRRTRRCRAPPPTSSSSR